MLCLCKAGRSQKSADKLTITLNRPENPQCVFRRHARDELCEALHLAQADVAIEQVTLNGRGPSFCAGGDLDGLVRHGNLQQSPDLELPAHPPA